MEVNALLANELDFLFIGRGQKGLNDIHGVTDATEEDPAVLSNALIQLDDELDKIANKGAYKMLSAETRIEKPPVPFKISSRQYQRQECGRSYCSVF
jgi:hypothetical protein